MEKFNNCDAILVTSDINRRYFTKFNSSAGMYVDIKGKKFFITDFRYITLAKTNISNCEVIQISQDRGYFVILNEIFEQNNVKTVGIEFAQTNLTQFEEYKSKLKYEFVDISKEIMSLRNVKSEEEFDKMVASQNIIDEVFEEILVFIQDNYKKGLTEKQIASEMIYLMYKKGADGLSFQPIVASGPNGASPHARPTHRKIEENEFITMDFGCMLDGYASDMTRTICVGKPTEEMTRIYHLVLEAQKRGIDFAKAGVKGSEIHAKAYDYFKENNMEQYFGHGYGHGIGMECHEGLSASPACHENLPENFFVSAEPGLYIEGFCGVRIEDIICLKKDGNVDITKSRKNLIIIE